MSEWRSACMIAPYPPELLPNTPRRPSPPQPKRRSIAGSISFSRKSSQAPIEAELTYWLPPSRVKQSGKATTTGGMRPSPISRSSRSGRFSRKPTQFVCAQAAAGEANQVDEQRQSAPVVAGRNVDIDVARGWITEHVGLERGALDGDAAQGSRRPGKLAHTCSSLCFSEPRAPACLADGGLR